MECAMCHHLRKYRPWKIVKWSFCAHVKPNTFTESLKYHYISKSHFIFHWKLQHFRWSTYIKNVHSVLIKQFYSWTFWFSYFRKWNRWSYFLFSLQRTLQLHEPFAFADVKMSETKKAVQIPKWNMDASHGNRSWAFH